MVNKDDILSIMRQWAPEDSAESWDNVGLQVDSKAGIENVALALEINLDTWSIIEDRSYDFIITHHPLIFSPIRSLSMDNWTHRVLYHLIQEKVGLYVSHTNLDRAILGVNDALVYQYDLPILNESPLFDGFGKVVELKEPITINKIQDRVSILASFVPLDYEISTIAFCAGSGKSFVDEVIRQGADLFVTGELGYHDIQTLRQQGVAIVLLGHYQSETFILDVIYDRLKHLDIHIDTIK